MCKKQRKVKNLNEVAKIIHNGTRKHELETVEEVIRQREEAEELRQLRNLKYNLETGIVREMRPELIKLMMELNWRDL